MAHAKHDLKPASDVLSVFGNNRALAKILKIHPSTITRWSCPAEQGGTNGRIPQKYWPAIMKAAAKQGKRVTVNQLVGVL